MAGYAAIDGLFIQELTQMADEGAAVERANWMRRLKRARAAVAAMPSGGAMPGDAKKVYALYDKLAALPIDAEAAAREPNDLDAIRALRPDGPRRMELPYGEDELLERLHGAWLGRCCGCALGKPFERAPFFGGAHQRLAAEAYLRAANAWPLDFYLPGSTTVSSLPQDVLERGKIEPKAYNPTPEGVIHLGCPRSHRERIDCMESDDDIRYTLIGLLVAEKHGADWQTADMARIWLNHLTYMQVCTAETQAFINLVNTEGARRNKFDGVDWLQIATRYNPCREWIGAQIRADHFGYAAAGRPERAAEMAWRDARLSHTRNGIYGEMFAAAAIAAAFATDDTRQIIEIGLSEIPRDCRLARALRETIAKYDALGDWVATWDWFRFQSDWGRMNPVHTIPNAIVVVLGLLEGARRAESGDGADRFERAIVQAVLGGFDTDCNGATVGSIVGAQLPAAQVPAKWTAPLHDTIDTAMPAFGRVSIRALAQRSLAIWRATRALANGENSN